MVLINRGLSGKSKINNNVLINGEVILEMSFINIHIINKVIHIGINKIIPVIKCFLKETFLMFI